MYKWPVPYIHFNYDILSRTLILLVQNSINWAFVKIKDNDLELFRFMHKFMKLPGINANRENGHDASCPYRWRGTCYDNVNNIRDLI